MGVAPLGLRELIKEIREVVSGETVVLPPDRKTGRSLIS